MNTNTELNGRYLSAKRVLFDKYYEDLNDRQREAVYSVNGPLLVLAGAGSGKTTVLVRRIAHIIKYGDAYNSDIMPVDGITEAEIKALEAAAARPASEIEPELSGFACRPCPPWAVLAFTFTNKAANEIKNRLVKITGENAKDIWAGTFHSICMRILRKYGSLLGYGSGFTVYDTDDSKKIISACLKHLNIDEKNFPAKGILTQISRAKDKLMTPEVFESYAGDDFKLSKTAEVYKEYQKRLSDANVLDFDDIIMQTVLLLKKFPDTLDYYRKHFKYICVDEYQDTNTAQFELISLLAGGTYNLMVVGDDDQSIYKFRGATIENILNFEAMINKKTDKPVKVVKLEQNYRSTQNILNAANSVIGNNVSRHSKELWTSNGEGDKVIVKRLDTQNDEAKYIINKIMDSVIREKRHYRDFAILYRMNAQSNTLEQIFTKSGIAYRILGGIRFYERKEIKDILAYLCIINNKNDSLRLKRIINEPKRKIGESTVTAVEAIANATGQTMFDVMENSSKYVSISKSSAKLKDFTLLIDCLSERAKQDSVSSLIRNVIDMTGYRAMILAMADTEIDRLQNIEELISNAIEYENTHEEPSLNGFLEEVSLVADIDNYDENADAVTLMTMHSAKGLEFPVVFLPGMEDGIFPTMQASMEPTELEEERRLAYVAVTRAKERLYMTHVRERMIYGRTQYNHISKFIDEIPVDYLDRDDMRSDKPNNSKPEKPKKNVISKEFFKKTEITSESPKNSNYTAFNSGDTVQHPSFGKGVILSTRQLGADMLYEIAFDDHGTKKLMATYAKLSKYTDE